MIENPVTYSGSQKDLVDAYNSLSRTEQDHGYWETEPVSPVRGHIKSHYEHEQNFKCCYCGIQLPSAHGRVWDVEHIVPKAAHPHFLFEPENLAVSCIDCNMAKRDKRVLVNDSLVNYPHRSDAFIIVHPHYDNLDDHIAVFLGRIYIPKTEKGEQTVVACQLLRYSYKLCGWDSNIMDNDLLMGLFEQLMNSEDLALRQMKKMEILLVLQVQLSRSLLPNPTTTLGSSSLSDD